MRPLQGVIRHYPWGSRSAIRELFGMAPGDDPCAELWLGAHPAAPGLADGEPLDALIAADPAAALGAEAAAEFGSLPFLFKVLSAAEPLSLQAHPSAAQAEAGYEAEDAAGIAPDSPQRVFRDRSHKPELICALSEFRAFCGFRDPAATLDLLDALGASGLDPLRSTLRRDPDASGLRKALAHLLSRDDLADTGGTGGSAGLVESVVRACAEMATGDGPAEQRAACEAVVSLGERYPDDPAVVAALLLNLVTLRPGEALFLAAGTLHCYLEGTVLEVMASSDNVVRGGLTSKHIDIDTLLAIADTEPLAPAVLRPEPADGIACYDAGVREFSLRRITLDDTSAAVEGPAVLLCTEGTAAVDDRATSPSDGRAGRSEQGRMQALGKGQAAWLAAAEGPVRLSGRATLYCAALGSAAGR